MKYFSLLCVFSTLTVFPSQMRLDIHNISNQPIIIGYNDIKGLQYKEIKNDTFITMFIQKSSQQPELLISLKIGKKPLKHYITPVHCTYRKFTINPDPEIIKAQKLHKQKRRVRFK